MFICEGELSLDIVREKINLLPSAAMHFAYEHNMPIFHCACGNTSVSLEIIECLLTAFPVLSIVNMGVVKHSHCARCMLQ